MQLRACGAYGGGAWDADAQQVARPRHGPCRSAKNTDGARVAFFGPLCRRREKRARVAARSLWNRGLLRTKCKEFTIRNTCEKAKEQRGTGGHRWFERSTAGVLSTLRFVWVYLPSTRPFGIACARKTLKYSKAAGGWLVDVEMLICRAIAASSTKRR